MGMFYENEEDRQYRDLIKTIRSFNINHECIDFLVGYVNSIREGKAINDFYDYDFLKSVMIKIVESKPDDVNELDDYLNELIRAIQFILPEGKGTEDYEAKKNFFLVDFTGELNLIDKDLFSTELYGLFNDYHDFNQIMSIIIDDYNLVDNFDKIVEFAITMGREIEDKELLKREVISYLHLYGSILTDDDDYLEKRINETRMKYGVYPGLDERTIASISRDVLKVKGLVNKLDTLERKIDGYLQKIDEKTKTGLMTINDAISDGKKEISDYSNNAIKTMQDDLDEAKKVLLEELNKYIVSLEEMLKNSSDQIFNKLLNDARDRVDQIRVIATGLSTTTTSELLKIQAETKKSLDTLKNYVESNPELRSSLKVATENEDVMKALLEFSNRSKETVAGGVLVTPKTELVVPKEDFLVPTFEMTPGILHAFDRSIAFDKRMVILSHLL